MSTRVMRYGVIGSVLVALMVGPVAPASAATVNCTKQQTTYEVTKKGTTATKRCWVDYNWGEELFQRKHDGYHHIMQVLRLHRA